jgi:hypothetical protein
MRAENAVIDKGSASVRDTEAVATQEHNLLNNLISNSFVHVLVLVAIVFYCYARTLGSYFLADDFGEVCYVHKIFQGDLALFWSNFTGNYMQVPGMSVYRPFLLTSLMLDYAVWGANAFGYYLSNILYFIGDCILLYCIVSSLTASWSKPRSRAAAFFSAALFAAYPLHCESISWVVGRVDIACCFYYLAAIYCFIRSVHSRNRLWLLGSVAGFCVGLLTKEMAIGLPVVVSTISFLFMSSGRTLQRFKSALKASAPLWLLTICYFPFRYLVLGTLTGGYTGGIGASQLGNIITKWTDPDTLRRIFFPLNYSVFQDGSIYAHILAAVYALIIASIGIRLLSRSTPWSWIVLCAVWLATAAAPIYQLWGLGYNLEGSRFFFFMTVPLSVIISVLAFAPAGDHADVNPRFSARLTIVNSATLLLLLALFARVSYLNNVPWVHAGKTVKEVQKQSVELAKQADKPDEHLIILGIPKDHGGAHMILNGATYAMMLAEPFIKGSCAHKFLTFDPVLFGNPDRIDSARFKQCLSNQTTKSLYFWDSGKGKFQPVALGGGSLSTIAQQPNGIADASGEATPGQWHASTADGASFTVTQRGIRITNAGDNDGIGSTVNLDPRGCDFLKLELRDIRTHGTPSVTASWKGNLCNGDTGAVPLFPSGRKEVVTVFLPLSRYWRWYAAGTICNLSIAFQGVNDLTVSAASLVDSASVTPSITIDSEKQSLRGVYESLPDSFKLRFDGGKINGACKTVIEISRNNYFFETSSDTDAGSAVMKRLTVEKPYGSQTIAANTFSEHGYYQIRARSCRQDGTYAGIPSEPVTVRF